MRSDAEGIGMLRRDLLTLSAAGLVAPSLARAQPSRVLRFVPQADLAITDPHFGIAFVTRNHAFLCYDFLYGLDAEGRPQPQMAAGHTTEDDARTWTITLRDGLRFHDGTPVLGRDVVASLRRWSVRNSFANSIFAGLDELSAPSDTTVRFRFRQPFRLVPELLGKPLPYPPAVMPERLAQMPATAAVPEIMGSGPYRFMADERMAGSRAVYARFDGYAPRDDAASGTAGGKVAHFDRVEWLTMPDAATAAAALQSGEVDWWEQPTADLLPQLRRRGGITVETLDPGGFMAVMRYNHTVAPFDRPAVRRAFLGAFDQMGMMTAVAGDDPSYRLVDVGYFHPTSPYATRAGLERLAPRSSASIRAELAAAGYDGELVRMIAPVDLPAANAMSELAADAFRKAGVNLDYVALDWGAALARLSSHNPVSQGGWSVTCNYTAGFLTMDPTAHGFLRGAGATTVFGWPTSPELESLRLAWMDATATPEQRRIAEQMQLQALQDVPYVPLGGFTLASAYRQDLTGMLKAPVPLFYNVRRA